VQNESSGRFSPANPRQSAAIRPRSVGIEFSRRKIACVAAGVRIAADIRGARLAAKGSGRQSGHVCAIRAAIDDRMATVEHTGETRAIKPLSCAASPGARRKRFLILNEFAHR
jgi:hypothetical protein